METAPFSKLMVTVEDVRPHLGIPANAADLEETLSIIQQQIDIWAMQVLEDFFDLDEVYKMTANQVKRAKNGLAVWVASEVLSVRSKNTALKAGDGAGDSGSFAIGPLHLSGANWGWAGGGSQLNNVQRMVDRMHTEARDILATLRIEIREAGCWYAV